jgi:ubiquinone/menaquinone biosynthesis C-methylase UbiE
VTGRPGSKRWGERAFWNLQSATWDDLLQKPRHRERLEAVVAMLTGLARQGQEILDLGCGTGTYSVALAAAGFDVVGLDFAPAMLRRAQAKARTAGILGPRLRFDQGDFNQDLTYADGSFDHVLCICALHCVRDPVALFLEVRRVLRPQGRFVLVALAGRKATGQGHRLQTTILRRGFWWIKRRMAKGSRWARYPRERLLELLELGGFDVAGRLEHGQIVAVAPAPAEGPRRDRSS